VCALRLRALYKKTDCAFCKVGFLFSGMVSNLIYHNVVAANVLGISTYGYFHDFSRCRIQHV
jgi:hypothetical protein